MRWMWLCGVAACAGSTELGPDSGAVGDAAVADSFAWDVGDPPDARDVDASDPDADVFAGEGCFAGEVEIHAGPGGRRASFPRAIAGSDDGWIILHSSIESTWLTFTDVEGVVRGTDPIDANLSGTSRIELVGDDVLAFDGYSVRRIRTDRFAVREVFPPVATGTYGPASVRRIDDAWRFVRAIDDRLDLVEVRIDDGQPEGLAIQINGLDELIELVGAPPRLGSALFEGELQLVPHADHLSMWWRQSSEEWRVLDVQLGTPFDDLPVGVRVWTDRLWADAPTYVLDVRPDEDWLIGSRWVGGGREASGHSMFALDEGTTLAPDARAWARGSNGFAIAGWEEVRVFSNDFVQRSRATLSASEVVLGVGPERFAAAMVADDIEDSRVLLRCVR